MKKTKWTIVSVIISLMIGSCFAYADPVEDLTTQQETIAQNIVTEQQQLDILSNEYNDALINQEKTNKQIKKIKKSIQETEKELQINQAQFKTQIVSQYKYSGVPFIDIVIDSTDFYSFLVNLDFYNKVLAQSNEIIKTNKKLKNTLSNQEKELHIQQEKLEKELEQIRVSKQAANSHIQELQEQYNQLDEEKAKVLIEKELAALTAQENVDETINNINITKETTYDENVEIEENIDNEDENIEIEDENIEIEDESIEIEENINMSVYEEDNNSDDLIENSSTPAASNDIVDRAYSMIGCPYSWGGTTSDGFDCSGFVSYCLTGQEGTRLGTTETFMGWTQVSDPQPGDICVIHNDSSQHTGVYVGDGKMVHAATYGVGVIEGDVQSGMTYVRYQE